jgi:hypothetical protein
MCNLYIYIYIYIYTCTLQIWQPVTYNLAIRGLDTAVEKDELRR